MAYVFAHKGLFAVDMLCALAVAAIDLIFPWVSRTAMNTLLPQKLFRTFFVVMAVMVAAYFLKSVLYYIITVVGHRMGVLTESDMRRDIFTHMQDLSCSFYDRNRTGVLMSRITSDLFEVTELSHHGPENIVICTLTILGALIVLFTIRWELALALTVILPLCLWFTLSQRLRMKRANVEVKRKTADIYAAIESSISGIRTAKAFANEHVEHEKFEGANALFRGAKVEYYKSMGLFMSGMEFTTGIMQVVVVAFGGLLIMQGKMDYVNLITFSLYVSTFVTPVRKLAQFSEQYMQGAAGFERFLEIMRTEPEIRDRPDAEELENVEGRVEYRDVCFAYSNGVPVLSHIDLTVEPGQCLAVVGPSGGGKTTLCQLLPRLYDVTGGAVLVDGRDVRDLTQASLRRGIGMLQQDVFLFAGTIRENIRYGRGDATDEEIVAAAIRAEIHDEIMALPDGYDSYIGERGVMLSGGQKQRVSIARIFLKNPKILILDEATSALDTVTEQRIQSSLDTLCEGRTSIIIAHRLSTIRHADRIAVIEGERIVEMGSHAELMEKNGVYAGLVRAQSFAGEETTC
ncbi:MAG: ABC transporter ATP-binding protein [Oscillospiraceae bacterium]|nr:ABC transporter ATP-binding protein [Oscillospiraceae bacterium]MBR0207623.1 ABC transporter ATP-binding protein [Oscillospiraceae bacterium]